MINETPLINLQSHARDDVHKELANKSDCMAMLLARCAVQLTAMGCDPNEAGSILKAIHDELGYT